jgi:hypothetical protein
MKKTLILVLVFLVSSAFILLSDTKYLTISQQIGIIALEAIIFQIALMDKSFLKKEKRAELRKVIEDYPV